MKILFLTNNDVGLYKFRRELLERLIKDGHIVYVSVPEGIYTVEINSLGCDVINTEISRRGMNPIQDLRLLLKYVHIVQDVKPDIVFTYTIKPNVYGGIACSKLKIPYVANITGLGTAIENGGVLQKITLKLYKIGLRKAQTVFFQNASNKKYIERKGIVKTTTCLIPGSGVNVNQYSYEEYPQYGRYKDKFLFVGRIMRDKGVEELFDVARRIKDLYPEVTFDVVGGFDEDYSSKVSQLENEGVIKYWGEQPDVLKFYKKCNAVILPSYHEGMANVLLEASSVGRPVLASNIPGCRETFDEKITGIGFEPHNSESLFEAVRTFVELNYYEKVDMGKAAREKMKKEFNRSIVVNAYLGEIEKIKI